MDATQFLNDAKEAMDKAADSNNDLDTTVFYSCRATTHAIFALFAKLDSIEEVLREISDRLKPS